MKGFQMDNRDATDYPVLIAKARGGVVRLVEPGAGMEHARVIAALLGAMDLQVQRDQGVAHVDAFVAREVWGRAVLAARDAGVDISGFPALADLVAPNPMWAEAPEERFARVHAKAHEQHEPEGDDTDALASGDMETAVTAGDGWVFTIDRDGRLIIESEAGDAMVPAGRLHALRSLLVESATAAASTDTCDWYRECFGQTGAILKERDDALTELANAREELRMARACSALNQQQRDEWRGRAERAEAAVANREAAITGALSKADGDVCAIDREWPMFLAEPQPAPRPNAGPAVLELLLDTLRARAAAGELKYGTRLQPHNGRDAMVDLLQELADACMYVMQAIAERDAVRSAQVPAQHETGIDRASEEWHTADEWRAEAHETIKERDTALAQLAQLRQELDEAQEARAQACRERDEAHAELVAFTRLWVE